MAINVKESMVMSEDQASKAVVGSIHKSLRYMMFSNYANAQWVADREIKRNSFPYADVVIETNRKLFRYDIGDLFILPYERYDMTGIVCRVVSIQEEDLTSEKIIVTAIEDPEYGGKTIPEAQASIPESGGGGIGDGATGGTGGTGGGTDFAISPLSHFIVKEAPYALSGIYIGVIPIAARQEGFEVGYKLYMSNDSGASYNLIKNITSFAVYGSLVSSYPVTDIIDDTVGFQIDVSIGGGLLTSITRSLLFSATHLSLLGDEYITWQNASLVSGYTNRYEITGIYRGRFGSVMGVIPAGTSFYFFGSSLTLVKNEGIAITGINLGSTLYFKAVPYSATLEGTVATASPRLVTITGESREPYEPVNFSANGEATNATYSTDINLTWNPRVRGDGAGLENPDYYTDEEDTWEGLFEVTVYVGGSLVRTMSAIDNDQWVYTEAMNLSDNGTLQDVLFKLRNYMETGGATYYSDYVWITVVKV